MEISVDMTTEDKNDAFGITLTTEQAHNLAYHLEKASKGKYAHTDDKKFLFAFKCSFISCTQRSVITVSD